MYTMLPHRAPLFNPALVADVITPAWVRAQVGLALAAQARGEAASFGAPRLDPALLGTVEALKNALPHPAHSTALQDAVLQILLAIHPLGLLRPVPHGADRGLRAVIAWNTFVAEGTVDTTTPRWRSLLDAPLPKAIGKGLWHAGFNAIIGIRKAAGLYPFAGENAAAWINDRAPLACDAAMIESVCTQAAIMAAVYGTGQTDLVSLSDSLSCPKTGIRLEWDEKNLLTPALNVVSYDAHTVAVAPLGPYKGPKPIRRVAFTVPSGTLLMADWFRIPEFTEGVEPDESEISSDRGVDMRTRDHFERLGLLRVHTSNCVPSIVDDNGTVQKVYRFLTEPESSA